MANLKRPRAFGLGAIRPSSILEGETNGLPDIDFTRDLGEPKGADLPAPVAVSQPRIQTRQDQNETQPAMLASQKPSLWDKIKGYEEPSQEDSFGLERPGKVHQGYLSKILAYALPAAVGASQGIGVLPGLASAFVSERGSEARENKANMGLYNKDRAAALALKREQDKMDLDREKLKEERRYHGKVTGTDLDQKAIELEKKYRVDPNSLSDDEANWLMGYHTVKRTKKSEAPGT